VLLYWDKSYLYWKITGALLSIKLGPSYSFFQLYSALIKLSHIMLRIVMVYYQFLRDYRFFVSVHEQYLLVNFFSLKSSLNIKSKP